MFTTPQLQNPSSSPGDSKPKQNGDKARNDTTTIITTVAVIAFLLIAVATAFVLRYKGRRQGERDTEVYIRPLQPVNQPTVAVGPTYEQMNPGTRVSKSGETHAYTSLAVYENTRVSEYNDPYDYIDPTSLEPRGT